MQISVINNVEKVRKAKGISKTAVAESLGLSLQGYRHIVNHAVRFDVDRLLKVSSFLSIPPHIFFDDKLTKLVINELKGEIQLNENRNLA